MSDYWFNRMLREQDAISDATIEAIEKQLKKYYRRAMLNVIGEFEAVYDKILAKAEEGKEPTPAWLYSLDRYWQMQKQLKDELQKLGDKEVALMSKYFEIQWEEVYKATALPSEVAFSTISTASAAAMIKTAWLADGKTFSERIWGNTEKLIETLNEELVDCVITGKKTTELKNKLVERFNVSYRQAETLVRTEVSNIQTQAAVQRYKDAGITRYKFLGRETGPCGHKPDCHELNGKIFLFSEMRQGVNCNPIHPRCKCALQPIID